MVFPNNTNASNMIVELIHYNQQSVDLLKIRDVFCSAFSFNDYSVCESPELMWTFSEQKQSHETLQICCDVIVMKWVILLIFV